MSGEGVLCLGKGIDLPLAPSRVPASVGGAGDVGVRHADRARGDHAQRGHAAGLRAARSRVAQSRDVAAVSAVRPGGRRPDRPRAAAAAADRDRSAPRRPARHHSDRGLARRASRWRSCWWSCSWSPPARWCSTAAHQTYVPTLIEKRWLLDANAKQESTAAASEIVGPPIGGVLVQVLGAPIAILCDAVSYVVSALLLWRLPHAEAPPAHSASARVTWDDLKVGFLIVFRHRLFRPLALAKIIRAICGGAIGAFYVLYRVPRPAGLAGRARHRRRLRRRGGAGRRHGDDAHRRVTPAGPGMIVGIAAAALGHALLPLAGLFVGTWLVIPLLVLGQLDQRFRPRLRLLAGAHPAPASHRQRDARPRRGRHLHVRQRAGPDRRHPRRRLRRAVRIDAGAVGVRRGLRAVAAGAAVLDASAPAARGDVSEPAAIQATTSSTLATAGDRGSSAIGGPLDHDRPAGPACAPLRSWRRWRRRRCSWRRSGRCDARPAGASSSCSENGPRAVMTWQSRNGSCSGASTMRTRKCALRISAKASSSPEPEREEDAPAFAPAQLRRFRRVARHRPSGRPPRASRPGAAGAAAGRPPPRPPRPHWR